MHCKYLSVAPYKALEKFSKALYGTTGGTYSSRVFRPVMEYAKVLGAKISCEIRLLIFVPRKLLGLFGWNGPY